MRMFSLPSRSVAVSSRICCSVPRWIENCGHLYTGLDAARLAPDRLAVLGEIGEARLVRTACASSLSCRPSSISSRTACGSTLMPTPSGLQLGHALEDPGTGTPIWCRLSASVSPPMPPPGDENRHVYAPRYWLASSTQEAAVGNCEARPATAADVHCQLDAGAGPKKPTIFTSRPSGPNSPKNRSRCRRMSRRPGPGAREADQIVVRRRCRSADSSRAPGRPDLHLGDMARRARASGQRETFGST